MEISRNSPRAAAYGAATWGALFALVHAYWLFGGRLGLPAGLSVRGNLPLLIIDLVAIPLCAGAAVLALALVRDWGRRFPRRLLLAGAWGTAALLVVHSAPSVVDWAALLLGRLHLAELDAMAYFATVLYEPFFLAGGVLFGLAALGYQRTR
ncbi:DUF3995 domain-containing protein [Saccharopolyspora erythraea]|uniref:DUF3995 domain-containing protein n=1 Tax=Saccharopolyspora erythraea TaxID=1836 RepID=UPI001BA4CA6A|nr:DUF3995 domain-containing protein [Saccharopolyspora erythraea]QUH05491.1 DUF3995 domain-containing protein [Saccharopolyspora erythraea]